MVDYNFFPDDIKEKVLNQIENQIPKFEQLLDNSYSQYRLYDLKILKLNKFEEEIKKLLEFSMFLSVSWLEISYDVSIYLNTNINNHRILSLKNLIIHLNEGYKKIHHFTESKRRKSLWISNIVDICNEENFTSFIPKAQNVTDKILRYEKQYQNSRFKDNRDIFVHYQGSQIAVYEALNSIDVSSLFKNATDYLHLTSDISNLSTELVEKINKDYCS